MTPKESEHKKNTEKTLKELRELLIADQLRMKYGNNFKEKVTAAFDKHFQKWD